MSFKKYIITLISWLLIPYIIGFIVFLVVVPQYYYTLYPFIILIFIGMGFPYYKILQHYQNAQLNRFQTMIMVNMFFKLIVSAIVVLLYVALIKVQPLAFAISFFIFYAVLSIFEKRTFLLMVKTKS